MYSLFTLTTQQQLVLTVQAYDADDDRPGRDGGQTDEIIEFIHVVLNPVMTSNNYANFRIYPGVNGIPATGGAASMNMTYRVMCSSNSYGSDCGTVCDARDDTLGHYTCNSAGGLVCMTGYQDVATNCTSCVPATGCCEFVCVYVEANISHVCAYTVYLLIKSMADKTM